MSTDKPTLADSFRMLADLLDEHPEVADWYRYPSFGQHLNRQEAGALDGFAQVFDVPIEHDQDANSENGAFYSDVEAYVGVLKVRLQCRSEDYEHATGKTVRPAAVSETDGAQ